MDKFQFVYLYMIFEIKLSSYFQYGRESDGISETSKEILRQRRYAEEERYVG